jgi:hypothetical protein
LVNWEYSVDLDRESRISGMTLMALKRVYRMARGGELPAKLRQICCESERDGVGCECHLEFSANASGPAERVREMEPRMRKLWLAHGSVTTMDQTMTENHRITKSKADASIGEAGSLKPTLRPATDGTRTGGKTHHHQQISLTQQKTRNIIENPTDGQPLFKNVWICPHHDPCNQIKKRIALKSF